jgi:NAD(P)-dependent dehydrogenase (short-subunit alcohol dehydrogenase family)
MGLLEGKVAIVTGAGRGLGRAEALELAREGATVVVQDLGTAMDGSGSDEHPSHEVVSEIEGAGGKAVAHFGDIADYAYAQGLIAETAEKFGDVHVIVNNAGILRDRMIFNMEEAEWDSVVRVHLKGHFNTVRHATAYWRQRAKEGHEVYGRIINTTSEAALFGSPGQPNYAAAKSAIIGLTTSTANGMVKYGITSNAIAPRARTLMTETSMPEMFGQQVPEGEFDVWAPENVAPFVAFLASPQAARVTGQVFIVWGNQVTHLAGPRVDGRYETEGRWTPEGLARTLEPVFAKREPLQGFILPMA